MKFMFINVFLSMLVLLSGCVENEVTVHSTSKPDVEEVLTLDPEADIFLWDNTVYQTNIDWVEELTLTKNREIGEITSISMNPKDYEYKNGMANKLPVSAKIYTANERQDVLLVEIDGKLTKYLGIGEG
ncbi:hypothetical protein ACFQ4X_03785 [Fictibacillus halophilus]|uniref:hypothetical protein n=1 Tax=Fictibacillus halophilus TaxID=1610490 RepID=UPI003634335A